MLPHKFSDYVLVADLAATGRHVRFTDWQEVASLQTVHECRCPSFILTEDLKAGHFLIVGLRRRVQDLAEDIDQNTFFGA